MTQTHCFHFSFFSFFFASAPLSPQFLKKLISCPVSLDVIIWNLMTPRAKFLFFFLCVTFLGNFSAQFCKSISPVASTCLNLALTLANLSKEREHPKGGQLQRGKTRFDHRVLMPPRPRGGDVILAGLT